MRLISSLLLFFIGIPLLFGMIWATGAGRAVVHPNFLGQVPHKVVKAVPDVLDKMFKALETAKEPRNRDGKLWVKAVRDSQIKPSNLMKQLKMDLWLKQEVGTAFKRFGQAMRGKKLKSDIVLDLRPLKQALRSPQFHQSVVKVMNGLPACDDKGKSDWLKAIREVKRARQDQEVDVNLPACNPGELATRLVLGDMVMATVKMPDKKVLLRVADAPVALRALRTTQSLFWVFFLLPIILILAFSVIAGTGWRGLFQRCGWTSLVSGAIALGVAKVSMEASSAFLQLDPRTWDFGSKNPF